MSPVTAISRAQNTRRRLLLAGLIAVADCCCGVAPVRSDDGSITASYVTIGQLLRDEAKLDLPAVDVIPVGNAFAATGGSHESNLVTYLDEDSATKTRDLDSFEVNDEASNDKDAAKKPDESEDTTSKAETPKPTREKPDGDRLGGESIFGGDALRSPAVEGGRFSLPPLMVATTQTSEIGNGRTPDGFRGTSAQTMTSLPERGIERGVDWDWTVRTWAAPNTFSHPRYFEDRMLERHGHERFPHLQPLASGARFFATVPMLPYLMAVRQPCDCEYTLGYYRTGSCAPALKQRPPYERKAVIAQAAAVARNALILP